MFPSIKLIAIVRRIKKKLPLCFQSIGLLRYRAVQHGGIFAARNSRNDVSGFVLSTFFSFLKTASASNFQWLHWDTWYLTVSSYAFKQGLCVSWCSLFCRGGQPHCMTWSCGFKSISFLAQLSWCLKTSLPHQKHTHTPSK